MTVPDPFNLARFLDAQQDIYSVALEELRAGEKQSHWMWFIFPQVAGLGASETARHFAITGLPEARAFVAHPVLGPRLLECTRAALGTTGRSAQQIFGWPDVLKFRSSMTLFECAAPEVREFAVAIERFYDGCRDDCTLAILNGQGCDRW